jgi:16S rRNA (uracil1498-N3)-methyltransferase
MTSKQGHFLFMASRVENGAVFLDKEESRHAFSVLRLSPKDLLWVTDGAGTVYECSVTSRTDAGISAEIKNRVAAAPPRPRLSMVVGLCEKEAFENLCECLSALGAAEIIPCVCRYSQGKWWNPWDRVFSRLKRKMEAGIKQSLNPWLPACREPVAFDKVLALCGESPVLVADEGGEPPASIFDRIGNADSVSCFIGPPGGFSPEELAALAAARAFFVSLSSSRLRTELAAVVLCSAVMMASRRGARQQVI